MTFRSECGTILIVEGDVMLGKALTRALSRDGLTIFHASNATEALHLAERHLPQLVLLDCRLRDGNGVELAKELHSRCRGVPVIALADDPCGVYAASAGTSCFARVLTKSVNLKELRQAVDTALVAQSAACEAPGPSAQSIGFSKMARSGLGSDPRAPRIFAWYYRSR